MITVMGNNSEFIKPDFVMPFGKHRGIEMKNLSTQYLRWLAETIKEDNKQGKIICLTADKLYQERDYGEE